MAHHIRREATLGTLGFIAGANARTHALARPAPTNAGEASLIMGATREWGNAWGATVDSDLRDWHLLWELEGPTALAVDFYRNLHGTTNERKAVGGARVRGRAHLLVGPRGATDCVCGGMRWQRCVLFMPFLYTIECLFYLVVTELPCLRSAALRLCGSGLAGSRRGAGRVWPARKKNSWKRRRRTTTGVRDQEDRKDCDKKADNPPKRASCLHPNFQIWFRPNPGNKKTRGFYRKTCPPPSLPFFEWLESSQSWHRINCRIPACPLPAFRRSRSPSRSLPLFCASCFRLPFPVCQFAALRPPNYGRNGGCGVGLVPVVEAVRRGVGETRPSRGRLAADGQPPADPVALADVRPRRQGLGAEIHEGQAAPQHPHLSGGLQRGPGGPQHLHLRPAAPGRMVERLQFPVSAGRLFRQPKGKAGQWV